MQDRDGGKLPLKGSRQRYPFVTRVFADGGAYHAQPEWCDGIAHSIEATRGQSGHGDAFSPGWFELPLAKGKNVTLTVTAESIDPTPAEISGFLKKSTQK